MSAASNPLLTRSRTASGAIEPYRIVAATATDGVVVQSSAADDKHIGVSSVLSAADGGRLDVEHAGIVPIQYGADSIAPGDQLTSDADGKAVASAAATDCIIGIAMEGGDTDEICAVLIAPRQPEAGA